MAAIEVCLSPQLLHLYELEGKVVVVVDVLRATSTIITALSHHVERIIPVAKLEQCQAYKKLGYITAAERDGKKAEGFDLGNSPFSYMSNELKGKTVVLTTTNGTEAISKSKSAHTIVIGGFLNIASVAKFLRHTQRDTIILCAGWKGKINIEDTLFAGALLHELGTSFKQETDDCNLSLALYATAKDDMMAHISDCSHVKRLAALGIEEDIRFCLQYNTYNTVPYFNGDALVRL